MEWIGFSIVWLALMLLTYDSLSQVRKRRARGDAQPAEASVPEPELA